ncbi:ferrous iron transport protein B [Maridesulfovibrio bastinii]|uniref:ferrous iron transport protein B n=1 Tax=Maridesulfovibrio bastinii TaxID=47157 RepID=UPI000422216F|nr:ferrous iron transport protein B [Maridesulfovibrio bastinii]
MQHSSQFSSLNIAVAGQPNTGKSTVFNALTGLHQDVGNWAGKTVEKKTGKAVIGGKKFQFVDLPGTYSLLARSEEERIAVDYIIDGKPDAVLVVVNAANLGRTLNYCIDIMLMGVPCVLAVNMADVARQHGISIDIEKLEKSLGIPCVELVASRKIGIDELQHLLVRDLKPSDRDLLAELTTFATPELSKAYNALVNRGSEFVVGGDRLELDVWKALEGDSIALRKIRKWPEELGTDFVESSFTDTQAARFAWIHEILTDCVSSDDSKISFSDKWDKYFLHPFWGYLIIAGVLLSVLTLGLLVGYPSGIWIGIGLQKLSVATVGIIPSDMLVIKALVQSIFLSSMSLLCMVPLIAVFYFIFSFLEEVGYMPRVSFMMDSLMQRLGLNGMSFTPLLCALPCNVPGIIGVRTIATAKQRMHTLLLIPLVPCSSKIIVLLTLCTWLFSPLGAIAAAAGIMLFSFAVFVLGSLVFKNTLFRKGESYDMLMELPQFHSPNYKIILMNVYHQVLAFLKKASTIVMFFGVIFWFLSYYPDGNISSSFLAMLGRKIEPLASLMGLNWKLLTSLMTSVLSRETVLPTMALLYNVPVDDLSFTLRSGITTASAISFLLAQFLSMPCLASLGMIFKESDSWRATLLVIAYSIVLPVLISILTYTFLSYLI